MKPKVTVSRTWFQFENPPPFVVAVEAGIEYREIETRNGCLIVFPKGTKTIYGMEIGGRVFFQL